MMVSAAQARGYAPCWQPVTLQLKIELSPSWVTVPTLMRKSDRRLPAARRAPRTIRGAWLLPLVLMGGHAIGGSNDPLEYVDDQTGASVTAVNRPLIFAHKRSEMLNGPRDYVTLAGAAVDRSGKYSYVLVAYFWAVGVASDPAKTQDTCKPLAVELQDGRIELTPQVAAHDEGIGVAVHKPPFGAGDPCVYGTDVATLRRLSATPHPVLYSGGSSTSVQYELFEDRLSSLKELVERLKDTG
jgi:hypothetical protein